MGANIAYFKPGTLHLVPVNWDTKYVINVQKSPKEDVYIYAKFTTKAATSRSLGKPLLFKCNNNQWKIPGKSSIFSKAVERKFVALLQMISCPGNF